MALGSLVGNVIRTFYPNFKNKIKYGFSAVTHKLVSSSSQNINPKSYTHAKSLHSWHYHVFLDFGVPTMFPCSPIIPNVAPNVSLQFTHVPQAVPSSIHTLLHFLCPKKNYTL
jgi:hypothetical protein